MIHTLWHTLPLKRASTSCPWSFSTLEQKSLNTQQVIFRIYLPSLHPQIRADETLKVATTKGMRREESDTWLLFWRCPCAWGWAVWDSKKKGKSYKVKISLSCIYLSTSDLPLDHRATLPPSGQPILIHLSGNEGLIGLLKKQQCLELERQYTL